MKRVALVLALAVAVAGCFPPEPKKVPVARPSFSSEGRMQFLLRRGSMDFTSGAEALTECLKAAQEAAEKEQQSTRKARYVSASSAVDEAGKLISEYTEGPPGLDVIEKDFRKYDDLRLKAIAAGNQALLRLRKAESDLTPLKKLPEGKALLDMLDLASDDIESGIEGMGGTVEYPM